MPWLLLLMSLFNLLYLKDLPAIPLSSMGKPGSFPVLEYQQRKWWCENWKCAGHRTISVQRIIESYLLKVITMRSSTTGSHCHNPEHLNISLYKIQMLYIQILNLRYKIERWHWWKKDILNWGKNVWHKSHFHPLQPGNCGKPYNNHLRWYWEKILEV